MTRKFSFLALLMALCSGCSCSSKDVSRKATQANLPGIGSDLALTTVLRQNVLGLAMEDETQAERLTAQAAEFVELRKGRLARDQKARLIEHCAVPAAIEPNPFCAAIEQDLARGHASPASKHAGRAGVKLAKARNLLLKADLAGLSSYSEGDLLQALKTIRSAGALDSAVEAALTGPACAPASVLLTLGTKLENDFPDATAWQRASRLFEKAVDCGSGETLAKAAYRLGLMRVSENNCADVERLFSQIMASPAGRDYRSRSAYWRMSCAKQSGNTALEARMRVILTSEYPLSLHTLLASPIGPRTEPVIPPSEPLVRVRSTAQPELNRGVRAAEALIELQATEHAYEFLSTVADRMAGAEPEFRLYIAVLLMRTGETIRKFQVLTALFREHPRFISKPALEMLYPLQNFDLVTAQVNAFDPLLVMSLIRQESAFNVRARSRVGAMGLMQVMPATARRMEPASGKLLLDPATNVRIGVKYFSGLLERYSGDAELALAAYNAGPERVDDWIKRYPMQNRLLFLDLIPFRETREYVASIVRNYYWYLTLYERQTREKDSTVKLPTMAELNPVWRISSEQI